jgi:type IV pilus assembly protein PilC
MASIILSLRSVVMSSLATLALPALVEMCRMLRHGLSAGLSVTKVFQQLAQKGPLPARPAAGRIARDLERGESLDDALQRNGTTFPRLFLAMAGVGERTGSLPEIAAELEKYYTLQLQLKRQFLAQIAWPVFQLVAAVAVIALLLLVLGFIADMTSTEPLDPLGLGLTGGRGALIFLFLVFGTAAGLYGLYRLATRSLQHKAAAEERLLRVPGIGGCLEALALARFCLALEVTIEAGLPIDEAVRMSLDATGNAAFGQQADSIAKMLRAGDSMKVALSRCPLFPAEFRNIVAVGEEGGRLSEVVHQQAGHYQEEASRRLAALTRVAGFAVSTIVGLLIIVTIFRIYGTYLEALGRLSI